MVGILADILTDLQSTWASVTVLRGVESSHDIVDLLILAGGACRLVTVRSRLSVAFWSHVQKWIDEVRSEQCLDGDNHLPHLDVQYHVSVSDSL